MIRAPRLAVSRPMYAFDPDTFRAEDPDGPYGGSRYLRAVWFKRKRGVLVATMGTYPLFLRWGRGLDLNGPPDPDDYATWIRLHDDNRYGGDHIASWDGTALLCSDQRTKPDVRNQQQQFLTMMLDAYPQPPEGYDGWWTFEPRPRW